MQERRGFERLNIDGKVNLRSFDGELCVEDALLDNISFGGFSFYAQQDIAVDKAVEFNLNSTLVSDPLAGLGRVRHVHSHGSIAGFFCIGIEFIGPNRDFVTHIIIRLQANIAEEIRKRKGFKPLDFMPY